MSLVSYAAKLAIKPRGAVEEAIFEHIWQQTPIEPVLAVANEGEFPTLTDQGEGEQVPHWPGQKVK